MRLSDFFRVDHLTAGKLDTLAGDALRQIYQSAVGADARLGWSTFLQLTTSGLPSALDISMGEILVHAWSKLCSEAGKNPNVAVISIHEPKIAILCGEMPLATVVLRAEVEIALPGLRLSKSDRMLVTSGEAMISGKLYCAGRLVQEEPRRPVPIPVTIRES